MRFRLSILALLLSLFANGAQAQTSTFLCTPQAGLQSCLQVSAGNPLPVSASVSASITGFPTTQSTGTPIAVTTSAGGVTGTLPTGAVVVAANVGTTNPAYCKLGASATTSDQYIAPSGGWFAFTVGASTQLTCISTGGTTTVNMVGGTGLPTGTGGGGGGAGGGGAITAASGSYASGALSSGSVASGAFASGSIASGAMSSGSYASGSIGSGAMVDLGAIADAAATTGSTGTLSAKLRLMTTQLNTLNTTLGSPFQAGGSIGNTTFGATVTAWGGGTLGAMANYGTSPGAVLVPGVNAFVTNSNANGQATAANSSPVVLPAVQVTADPCTLNTKTNFTIATSSGTVQIVAPSGSTQVYICSLFTIGATASIQNIVGGTGATCTTGTPVAIAGSTTAASGMSFAANGGFTFGNGGGTVLRTTTGGHGVCLIQSATAAIAGGGTFVQQ